MTADKILPVAGPMGPADLTHSDRNVVRQIIQRDWRPYLTPAQRDLVGFFFAASIERGIEEFNFTYDQLSRGILARGASLTRWLIPPIEIARTTFYRLLGKLDAMGVLIVSSAHRQFTRVKINLNWTPEKSTMPPKLAISKRRKAELEAIETRCNPDMSDDNLGSQYGTPLYTMVNKGSSSTKSNQSSRSGSTSDPDTKSVIERATADHRKIVEARSRRSKNRSSASAFSSTFRSAWMKAYPGVMVPGLTQKEANMLRASLTARFPDTRTAHEFLEFVVSRWDRIIGEKFGWMDRPAPKTPSLRFMLSEKIMPTFLDAYAERDRLMQAKTLKGDEAQIDRLMRAGKTREEALVQIGERRAQSKNQQAPVRDFSYAARERQKIEEERKQLLRDKAAATPQKRTQHDFSDELGEFKLPDMGEGK